MLRERVPNIDQAVISMHCHNDLGLAVANSLAAVENGAGQIECTVNGLGERAGNCSLEEVVMAMKTRSDYYHCRTAIHTQRLVPTSRLVSAITGMQVQRNKAVVGRNAFAHEAGIHQDGMLKERSTYEIMRPEDVGFAKTDLVLGKHSGRAALADRAKALGFRLTGQQLHSVFEEFKRLADKKKEIYDGDVAALIEQQIHQQIYDAPQEEWSLDSFHVSSGTGMTPRIQLTLRHGQEASTAEVAAGDGPIDAAFWATEKITGVKLVCKDFRVRSATIGRDAQGEATLEVEHEGQSFRGRGVLTDTVEASIRAILSAPQPHRNSQTPSRRRRTQRAARGRPRVAPRSLPYFWPGVSVTPINIPPLIWAPPLGTFDQRISRSSDTGSSSVNSNVTMA